MPRIVTPLNHPVVILGRGFGSRLQSVATGVHKTTERVGEHTILGRMLNELRSVRPTALHLHLREPDRVAAEVAAAHPQEVQISFGPPPGYLNSVIEGARLGERFTAIEADTITHPGSLTNFLILVDRIGSDYDLCMGVAPAAANPNGPAVIVDDDGLVQDVSWTAQPTGLVPLGAWHWTRQMLVDAPKFAAEQSTSIASYISWSIPLGAAVVPVGFPAGHNINTPDDLEKARSQVIAWTKLTERSTAA